MEADDPLTFPDSDRLRALIAANRAVTEELELGVLLGRIVDAAVELVDARYGAMGVFAPHGSLERFIQVGVTPERAERIGHPPEGHGLLGAIIDDQQSIRTADLTHDTRFIGFPEHHPRMSSFLGVPVRVRDEVFGNLYLADKRGPVPEHGGEFTAEDEYLLTALAATAGVAIDNARLFDETRSRQAWTAAAMELTAAMLGAPPAAADRLLASASVQLADAESVSVLEPGPTTERWRVTATRGREGDEAPEPVTDEITALADAALASDSGGVVAEIGTAHLLAVPVPLPTPWTLLVSRAVNQPRFTAFDVRMATAFCAQAAVAIELVWAREDQQRMVVLEDRGRIARDLHDHVIQRLFAAGLTLQAVDATGATARVVNEVVDSLDASISQIRTAIFALSAPASGTPGLRRRLIGLADESRSLLGHLPTVTFAGAVDHSVTSAQAQEVLAVCREALANTAKHADATTTSIHLAVDGEHMTIRVSDDGTGFDSALPRHASGLANLRARAERLGGWCDVTSGEGGTRVLWSVPIIHAEPSSALGNASVEAGP